MFTLRGILLTILPFTVHLPSACAVRLPFHSLRKPLSHRLGSRLDVHLLTLRGGGDTMTNEIMSGDIFGDTLKNALSNGPHVQGVLGLYAISFGTVILSTMVKTSYAFTVGYGLSVAATSLVLMAVFGVPSLLSKGLSPPELFANCTMIYGFRLAAYLLFRNFTVPSKAKSMAMASIDSTPRPKRVALALNVALLYAFMLTPVLYSLRSGKIGDEILAKIQWLGVIIAYVGLAIETVSDAHKYAVKNRNSAEYGDKTFVGPTSGSFRICRHPAYFGEVLHWFGIFVGGIVSFGPTNLVCSTLGICGISFVMISASKRLDRQQLEAYSGQQKYDDYRSTVKGSIFPSI